MTTEDLLQEYPLKRIKPADGMAVTAEVWEEAHQYPLEKQRFHALFSHGPGILTGLEVIASDPPDRSVYILPGIAVDPQGHEIVLPQPVAYDLGDEIEGPLYLLLSHAESRVRAEKGRSQPDDPRYIHAEFSILARPTLPETPVVELARLTRQDRKSLLVDAADSMHPGPNEIDLRYRQEVGPAAAQMVNIAVVYLGDVRRKNHGRGAGLLARWLNGQRLCQAAVDDDVPLAPGVLAYSLVYLVAEGTFELSRSQVKGLQGYIERGGTLFVESCNTDATDCWQNYFQDMGVGLEPLAAGHPLLTDPYLFATPPAGYDGPEGNKVLCGPGVIFSTSSYGRLWLGERREGSPSREQIRSATEWGANLLTYGMKRRRPGPAGLHRR